MLNTAAGDTYSHLCSVPVSPTLSLHLPHADSAAENSDCTVVRQRVILRLRYNKTLSPQKKREKDRLWEGGARGGTFHLHHYLLTVIMGQGEDCGKAGGAARTRNYSSDMST